MLICLSTAGFAIASSSDDCEPCEEGDPECGGNPDGDYMPIYIAE